MTRRPGTPFILGCLWLLFLARGLFYISILPLWEGFDEWAHYAVVQAIATGGHLLPDRNGRVSREVESSLNLVPWRPWEENVAAQHAAYWRLPDMERAARERELRSMPARWANEIAPDGRLSYEAQQAPLFYWVFSLLYRLTESISFLPRVWLLRLASLVVGSTVIPIGFLVARKVFTGDAPALGIVTLIASMPQLTMTVGRVSNDSLAIPMGALLLYCLIGWKESPSSTRRSVILGITLGLALLTKAYFLAFVPFLVVCIWFWGLGRTSRRPALILVACAIAISSWWYTHNWMLTRSLTGETIEIAAASAGPRFFDAAFRVKWIRTVDFTLLSQIWLGNWSFLVVRSWMYHFFYILVAGACAGLVFRLARHQQPAPARHLILLAGVTASFLAAVGYHTVGSFQTQGVSWTFGHYVFPAIVAEAILLRVGLESIVPKVVVPVVTPFLTTCLSALELFGLHFIAIAYYVGYSVAQPNGGLPALRLDRLLNGGLHLLLSRLAENKPFFLSATVIAVLWGLYLAATFCLNTAGVYFAYTRVRKRDSDSEPKPAIGSKRPPVYHP